MNDELESEVPPAPEPEKAAEKPCMCEDPSDEGLTHCKDTPCFTTPPPPPAPPAPEPKKRGRSSPKPVPAVALDDSGEARAERKESAQEAYAENPPEESRAARKARAAKLG